MGIERDIKLKHNIKKYVASKQTAISKKYKVGDDVLANGNTGVITEVTEDVTVVLYKVRLMTNAETWFSEGDIVKVELAEYTATKKKQVAAAPGPILLGPDDSEVTSILDNESERLTREFISDQYYDFLKNESPRLYDKIKQIVASDNYKLEFSEDVLYSRLDVKMREKLAEVFR